jgi:hypothetical protein
VLNFTGSPIHPPLGALSSPVRDLFPFMAKPTVGSVGTLDIVRCTPDCPTYWAIPDISKFGIFDRCSSGLDLRPRHDPHIGPCRHRPTIRLDRARSGSCQKLCALVRPIRHITNVHLYPSGHPYPQKLNIKILYYTNVKYIHLNTITKFLASFNNPFNTPKIIG